MVRLALALSLAASLAGAADAGAQQPQQPPPALPARLGAPARAAIEALADTLRRDGLPADALYAKAAEGVLKGADDARIVGAVRTLARELGDARGALGAGASAGEVLAGASALHAGIAPEQLRRLRLASEGGTAFPAALVVVVDLVARRVPADVAVRSVETLVARRAGDGELQALRVGVEQDILAGRSPAAAAESRTRAIVGRMP